MPAVLLSPTRGELTALVLQPLRHSMDNRQLWRLSGSGQCWQPLAVHMAAEHPLGSLWLLPTVCLHRGTGAQMSSQWSSSTHCIRGSVGLFSCAVCWIHFYFHCDSFCMDKSTLLLAKHVILLHCKRKVEALLLSANVYKCGEYIIRRGGSKFLFWRKIKIVINRISFAFWRAGCTLGFGQKIQGTLAVLPLKLLLLWVFFFHFCVVWSTKWDTMCRAMGTESCHWASLSADNVYSASGSWMSLQVDYKKFAILCVVYMW